MFFEKLISNKIKKRITLDEEPSKFRKTIFKLFEKNNKIGDKCCTCWSELGENFKIFKCSHSYHHECIKFDTSIDLCIQCDILSEFLKS